MKIINLVKLSLYNLIKSPKVVLQLTFNLVISFSLISIGLIYSLYVDWLYDEYSQKYVNNLILYCCEESCDLSKTKEIKEAFEEYDNVTDCQAGTVLNLYNYITDKSILEMVSGDTYMSVNGEKYVDLYKGEPTNVISYYLDSTIIKESSKEKYKEMFGDTDILCYGSYATAPGEIMINENTLERYGVSAEDYEKLIGKNISFIVGESVALNNLTISGIMKKEFLELEPSGDVIAYMGDLIENENIPIDLMITLKKYDTEKTDRMISEISGKYNVEIDKNRAINLIDNILLQKEFCQKILIIIMLVIFLVAVLSTIIFLMTIIIENNVVSAMFLSLGMREKNLIALRLSEFLFISIGSAAVCLALIFLWSEAVTFISSELLYIDEKIPYNIILKGITVTAVSVTVVIGVIYYLTIKYFINKFSVNELLNGE